MHSYRLYRHQFIPKPLAEVFAFFEDPQNLARITPKNLNFRNLAPQPVQVKEGARIFYQIKIKGIPIRWESLITQYDPPHLFVDEQVRGPYAFWRHIHRFKKEGVGTLMEDEVTYSLPWGPLGRLAHFLIVKKDLKKIFDYREKALTEIFG
jgi:ligand-binding SRPBCC domain-containing protein